MSGGFRNQPKVLRGAFVVPHELNGSRPMRTRYEGVVVLNDKLFVQRHR
jgi:hypothetical protein